MRWLTAVVSVLSVGTALAAKKSTVAQDTFTKYHTKALSSTPAKLVDSSFKDLTGAPRDYSVTVLLTALETRFGCQVCREFQPEWELLSKSWTRGDKAGRSRLIYGTLDFSDGRDTFMALGLQTAPVLLFFPPTTGAHAAKSPEPIRFDFSHGPQSAEQIHQWIARNMPDRPHPPVKRPINWLKWIVTMVSVAGGLTGAVVAWPYLVPILQSRNVWAAVSLIGILLFTSGHMFNHIRKVPYVAADGKGGITYIAGGFQSQFGLETQIVAAIYGILAFAAICLAVKVPRMANPKTQGVAVIAWTGVMYLMYSFLLSVFRWKNGGYPFSLPPFM